MNRVLLSLPLARYTGPILEYFKTTLNSARASSGPWSGEIKVGKCLRVIFPSAALDKTIQRQGWGGGGHHKKNAGLLWDCGFGIIKKKDSKYFTQECSAGIGHEGLVVLFTHWFPSTNGKLFLTLCGCFCADDWVQNMSTSISLIWEGFVPAVLRVGSCTGGNKEENQAPDDSLFLKKEKKNQQILSTEQCPNQGKCFFLKQKATGQSKGYLDAVLWNLRRNCLL